MPANVITGEGGAVGGAVCVRLYKVERINEPARAVCSASDGAVIRLGGIDDWRGIYMAYGHTPAVLPGDLFQFIGATRDGKGASSVANGAIVERIRISWDIEGKDQFIQHAVQFARATGALSFGAASATDVSTPDPATSRSMTINLTGCTELRKMDLELISHNPRFVTGSTAGGRERKAGTKDGRFTCKIYTEDADFPANESIDEVEFSVGGGLNWTMKWALLTLTAPLLRIENGLFEADLAGEFTGYKDGSKGNITSPAGVAWWP